MQWKRKRCLKSIAVVHGLNHASTFSWCPRYHQHIDKSLMGSDFNISVSQITRSAKGYSISAIASHACSLGARPSCFDLAQFFPKGWFMVWEWVSPQDWRYLLHAHSFHNFPLRSLHAFMCNFLLNHLFFLIQKIKSSSYDRNFEFWEDRSLWRRYVKVKSNYCTSLA